MQWLKIRLLSLTCHTESDFKKCNLSNLQSHAKPDLEDIISTITYDLMYDW